ncbi:hypothetical protein D3C72_1430980 [compost metagenome]
MGFEFAGGGTFARRGRRKIQRLVHALGKAVEGAHLHLQAQGDRLQRLAAQVLQVGILRDSVNRLTAIQAGTQLQRYALETMVVDRRHLLAQDFQALAGGQQLLAVG